MGRGNCEQTPPQQPKNRLLYVGAFGGPQRWRAKGCPTTGPGWAVRGLRRVTAGDGPKDFEWASVGGVGFFIARRSVPDNTFQRSLT
jgi:hypothetical protein